MPKQGVAVDVYYSGSWHPVTVYARDPVTITRGKQDEAGGPVPAAATFTVDNRSGDWSVHTPTAALYGLVGRNTPVRISVDGVLRFWGEIAAMSPGRTPDFDQAAGRGDAWVRVEAAGPLRRLNAGRDPLASPLRRAILALDPTAYWPLEDGQDARAGSSAVDGVPAMQPYGYSRFQVPGTGEPEPAAGLPRFGTGTGIPGSLPVPDWTQGGVLVGHPPAPAGGTSWRVAFVAVWPRDRAVTTIPIGWTVTAGTYTTWQVHSEPDGLFVAVSEPASGTIGYAIDTAASINLFDGLSHFIEIAATTDGSALDAHVYIDGWDYGSLSLVNAPNFNHPVGQVASIALNYLELKPGDTGVDGLPQLGHVAVWQPSTPMGGHVEAMRGHAGETTLARFGRLCDEHGVTAYYSGPDPDDVQTMGIQRAAPLADLLGEIERTEAGVIYETRADTGLVLATGRGLYGQTPAVTLDYTAGHIAGLSWTVDDQGVANDVTASSTTTGVVARRTLDAGPLSTAPPPDGIGRYETRVDVNPAADDRLASYAQRRLYAGTLPGPRFPQVVVDVATNATIAAAVADIDPGDRVRITGMPPDITPDDVDLVVIGTIEVIGTHTRTITLITGPYAAVDAAQVGACRAGSDTSYLSSSAGASDTSLSVTRDTGSARWATAADGAVFPFDLALFDPAQPGGRERVTLTAVTGTDPQTFTVTRAVNGVSRAWPAGTRVRLWDRPVVGL